MSNAGPWSRPLLATHSRLLDVIAFRFDVPVSAIIDHDRHKSPSAARHVFWWVLRLTTKHSFPELGSLIGGASPFDHTSVMAGLRRISDARIKGEWPAEIADEMLANELEAIRVRTIPVGQLMGTFDANPGLRGKVTTPGPVIPSGECRAPSPAPNSSPPSAP